MKKTKEKIQREILFYANKLPAVKQLEALDFVKWLWGGPGAKEGYSEEELRKIETLAKKRGGKKFKNWESAKKYLESLMH